MSENRRNQLLQCLGRRIDKPSSLDIQVESQHKVFQNIVSIDSELIELGKSLNKKLYSGYEVYKVTYNVEPRERISAWLLVPLETITKSPSDTNFEVHNGYDSNADPTTDRKPVVPKKWPCVLAIHQHGGQFKIGKSEPAGMTDGKEQEFGNEGARINYYGPRLCTLGFAVFCPDMLGFEDRRPSAEIRQRHDGHIEGHKYEHYEALRYSLQGRCLQLKYLHDLSVAIDVLTSPEIGTQIDGTRIASLGHSLGGQEASWIAWYDSRVKAVVSSCGASMIKDIVDNYIVHNKALYVPGMFQVGDIDCMLTDIAPRPLFMSSGTDDWLFPLDGVKHINERLKEVYEKQGASEKLTTVIFKGGHTFEMDIQVQAYAFLLKWL